MRLGLLPLLIASLTFAAVGSAADEDGPSCDPGTVELARDYATSTLTCRVIADLRPEELAGLSADALARLSADDRLALEVRRLELAPPGKPIKPGALVVPAGAVRRDVLRLIATVAPKARLGGGELPLSAITGALRLEAYGVDAGFIANLEARGALRFLEGTGRNEGAPARTEVALTGGRKAAITIDRVISGRIEPSGAGFAVKEVSGLRGSMMGFIGAKVTGFVFLPDRILIHARVIGIMPATITLDLTKEEEQ